MVYWSTRRTPSLALRGIIGVVFVRSRASCCSASKRPWLCGIVSALLLVLDTPRLSINLSEVEVDVDEDVDLAIGYWQ